MTKTFHTEYQGGFNHEYNEDGNHRLVLHFNSGKPDIVGDWVPYAGLAILEHADAAYPMVRWVCATDYWAGTLEPDKVTMVSVSPRPTSLVMKPTKDIRYGVEALIDG